MQCIFCDIPRPEKEKTGKNAPGSHGWRFPKMHTFSLRKFGRAKCFDSGLMKRTTSSLCESKCKADANDIFQVCNTTCQQ
jgi:hypothetical protein